MVLKTNLELITSSNFIIVCIFVINGSLERNVNEFLEDNRFMSFRQGFIRKPQISNNTIYEDGIPHIEINELNTRLNEIVKIEEAYKNIIAMNGTKYIYKRNFYWRTWRAITNKYGNTSLVCYKCRNIVNGTCVKCNCGVWEIEERPPCPFEIFSVINSTTICIAKYNQLKNSNASCPSTISFTDLLSCDNPIESRWRVSRKHDSTITKVSERYINIICEKRENCEFSTIYSILSDRIVFKIINSTNHINYSRIMKYNNRNYACVNNCGFYKSFIEVTTRDWITPPLLKFPNNTTNEGSNVHGIKKVHIEKKLHAKVFTNMEPGLLKIKSSNYIQVFEKATTKATLHCRQIQKPSEEEYEENDYDDY